MAYWRDNADSYVCSACGYECNNPNKLPRGPGVCPSCQSIMISAGGISAPLTGWISVKDRLPEESGRYFVADFERDYFAVLRFSSVHGVFNAFDSFSSEDANAKHIEVSHWMPLPEPPEEGTT